MDFDQRDILAYLDGNLTEEQRQAVDERLRFEPAFRKRFDEYAILWQGLDQLSFDRLVATAQTESRPEAGKRIFPRPSLRQWLIAAAALVVLSGGYSAYSGYRSYEENELFARFYQPERADPGDDPLCGHLAPDVRDSYFRKEYEQTLRLLAAGGSGSCTHYYRGLAYLASARPEEAIAELEQVRKEDSQPVKERADWYLALAFLKNHRRKESVRLLRTIAENKGHIYQLSAQKMLETI